MAFDDIDDKKSTLRVGIAGLGTVGTGVLKILSENAETISRRADCAIKVTAVSARNRNKIRDTSFQGITWYDDAVDIASDPNVDIVIEVIGGSEGKAYALIEKAIALGKPVVTANKALLAVHGTKLAQQAEKTDTILMFEAAVAGGIPIIKTVREGLAADHLIRIQGILNGTCNYILTAMREQGRQFEDVLAEAQMMGFAEADPSIDIDGHDTAHKLTILAALAFGWKPDITSVYCEGIRRINSQDMIFSTRLGYQIKMLAQASCSAGGVLLRVHPCLVPTNSPLGNVNGTSNAIVIEGQYIGRVMLEGPGAGQKPTAMAVVTDIIDIARGSAIPTWGAKSFYEENCLRSASFEDCTGSFYLRVMMEDKAGVVADITAVLRDYGVSLVSLLQYGNDPESQDDNGVPVVIVTHPTREDIMAEIVNRISRINGIKEEPFLIRIISG